MDVQMYKCTDAWDGSPPENYIGDLPFDRCLKGGKAERAEDGEDGRAMKIGKMREKKRGKRKKRR
jgi:hypothetical protein